MLIRFGCVKGDVASEDVIGWTGAKGRGSAHQHLFASAAGNGTYDADDAADAADASLLIKSSAMPAVHLTARRHSQGSFFFSASSSFMMDRRRIFFMKDFGWEFVGSFRGSLNGFLWDFAGFLVGFSWQRLRIFLTMDP